MNVDFGLVCLFAIQIGLVFLVYHAWKGIKAEISALEAHRRDNAAVAASVIALDTKFDALAEKVGAVEVAPKAAKARMDDVDEVCRKMDRRIEAVDTKVVSLSARVSAYAKHRKASAEVDTEETDPAPQGEGEIIPMGFMPPGSQQSQPQSGGLPPGFGVLKRRRHG